MNLGRGRELTGPDVTVSAHGTDNRNDSLSEHGKDWDTGGWQRHVDGAGCFIEKSQSTRPTSMNISDDNTEGIVRARKVPGIKMRLREGDDERKLFERFEEARVENGKVRHGGRW
jgi:hypothetical protein